MNGIIYLFFFKQKTAYEMRISDWSSDVCSSDLFDAFAPAVQPGMWTQEVISHVTSSLSTGGVFVSYSITGKLKRILKELGFAVEKPEGAAGKREMIRATRSVVTNKF